MSDPLKQTPESELDRDNRLHKLYGNRPRRELYDEIERLRSDARAYADIMLSEENDALIEENKRLRAVIVRSKDALLDGQSTQWVHDLLAGALHKEEHRGGMPFGGQSL